MGLLVALALGAGVVTAQAETGLGRHKKVYAVPTPGKVVIDGKLDDWDLSGQIEMFVMSETKEMQSAKFAQMYDAEALYVSAEVRDPSPLMNRQDPQVKGDFGWDADSCQFRLMVDPAQGYPINQSSFQPVDNPQMAHLILWHYTDREEACLQMHVGMNYKLPRPEWAPFGVVPATLFQAKYLKAADGRGYTFEYRIPWSTLNAKTPPKGGDLVAGTVQFNWGQPDGLKTAGGSAWCYDVLAGPGFPYQSTACWGKILFSATGNLAKSLVEEGLPPELPLPLTFAYQAPEESELSVALFDQEGTVVKTLVAQGQRRAGENVERWDGFGADGKPLPAGEYTWKGVYHKPITTKFVMSVHNSGQPGYQTDAPSSAWGADHGTPTTVCATGDGVLLAWNVCELGWAIIKTDLKGKKIWGSKESARFLAVDGDRFFAAGGHGFQEFHGVKVYDLKDGRPLNFASGTPELVAPAGGEAASNEVTGLACANGIVYVAHGKRNLIALHDAKQGTSKGTIEVPAPGAIAVRPDGSLAVVSGATVVAVKDGKVTPLATEHLDAPRGIAVAADGTIYVANGGALQNVSVFGPDGKYLRSIGKAGGRLRVGRYDREGMLEPGGIAIAKDGRLWVAEALDSPKRHSVWNAADGGCADEFFGGAGYFGWIWMDPEHPAEAYCNSVLWKIDLDKGTWRPHSTIWRATQPNMIHAPAADGYAGHFRVWTAKNGRQYGWGMIDYSPMLFLREGDLFKPIAGTIRVAFGAFGGGLRYPAMKGIYEKTKAGAFLWQDKNNDQCVQEDELVVSPAGRGENAFNWIDRDFNVWSDAGFMLRPARFEADGRPVYDFEKREAIPFQGDNSNATSLWLDEERGDVYTLSGGVFARRSRDGKPVWAYRGIVPWNQALGLPLVKPGLLHGLTMPLGVAGDFTGAATYFNPYHIFTRDGVYVAMLTRDGRDGKGFDWNLISSETIQGQLVKPKGMNPSTSSGRDRYFLLSGAGDGRILEVLGLDTVKPLAGGTYVHTPAMVTEAVTARQEYDRALARSRSLEILRGKPALAAAPAAGKRVDEARAFTARATYDAENLYLQYEVTSPAPLVNAATDYRLLFKSGNCLDLQLAADPAADPKRKTPAPGDVRVLITRQAQPDGKTFKTLAVVYRPKVKEFKGEPFVFTSPTGKEAFDVIETTDRVTLEYKATPTGFSAVATLPLELLGLQLTPGRRLALDLGYLFGNATGTQTAARAYWCNSGFSANVTYDVPNESRLEPAEWGEAVVE
jgi:hypothetical protein